MLCHSWEQTSEPYANSHFQFWLMVCESPAMVLLKGVVPSLDKVAASMLLPVQISEAFFQGPGGISVMTGTVSRTGAKPSNLRLRGGGDGNASGTCECCCELTTRVLAWQACPLRIHVPKSESPTFYLSTDIDGNGFSRLLFEVDVCSGISAMLPSESSKTMPLDEGDRMAVVGSVICEKNQLFTVSRSEMPAVPQFAHLELTQLPDSAVNDSVLTSISKPYASSRIGFWLGVSESSDMVSLQGVVPPSHKVTMSIFLSVPSSSLFYGAFKRALAF